MHSNAKVADHMLHAPAGSAESHWRILPQVRSKIATNARTGGALDVRAGGHRYGYVDLLDDAVTVPASVPKMLVDGTLVESVLSPLA